MLNKILDGVVEHKPVVFIDPPKGGEPYAVTFDDIQYSGSDTNISIATHNVRIELYSRTIRRDLESEIESNLKRLNQPFEKGEKVYLLADKDYMQVYYLEYIEKLKP